MMFSIGMAHSLEAQPGKAEVEADLRRTFSNVQSIDVGKGSSRTELEQGSWVTHYRVPVSVITATNMKNVQRLYKGAAVYHVSGSRYQFLKYNPGTGQYIGLPALNERNIQYWILQNYQKAPELFLPMRGQEVALHDISIEPDNQIWNSMISVSLRAWVTSSYANGLTLIKQRKPYELRLFRKMPTDSAWSQLTWIPATPSTGDNRKAEVLETSTLTSIQQRNLKNLLQIAHSL